MGVDLIVVVLMIGVNSIFAGYEIALASVGLARLDTLVRQNRRGAAAAYRMKGRMEASLAVVQLGITLVGVIAAATGGAGAAEEIEPLLREVGLSAALATVLSLTLVVIPLTFLTIIFGELVPKVFALRNTEWVCLRLSPIMEWFSLAVRPAVWVLEKSVSLVMAWGQRRWRSEDSASSTDAPLQELRAIAAIARTSRLIGTREEGIIVNAARLSHTPISAIMLPAADISMMHLDDSLEDCLIAAHHDLHTRFPATSKKSDPQAIVGYVNFKDIIASMRLSPRDASLRGILRPLIAFRVEQTVAACLEQMIHLRNHIALVKDRDQNVVGMITLEDILEELLGEIHDEYDRIPAHISRSGAGWIVGGHATLEHIQQATGIELPLKNDEELPVDEKPKMLTDWVQSQLGQRIQGGEVLSIDGLRVVVRKVRRQSVLEAQLTPSNSTDKPPIQ